MPDQKKKGGRGISLPILILENKNSREKALNEI